MHHGHYLVEPENISQMLDSRINDYHIAKLTDTEKDKIMALTEKAENILIMIKQVEEVITQIKEKYNLDNCKRGTKNFISVCG